MNKECYLTLTVRVTGNDEPAHDFAADSIALVHAAINAASTDEHKVQVIAITEETDFDA